MLRIGLRIVVALLSALLLLEGVMRLLPVSTATLTGYHHDADLLTYPSHHRWRVATGWDLRNAQQLRSNNFGFVADIDFVPDPRAVALIGDSFVEASMLDAVDRPGAVLQRMLSARPIYALGGPGSSLLDYAQRIRWSHEQLQVRDFVLLLERSDARQSLCGSGNVHSRCLDATTLAPRIERQAPPGLTKRVLRHSALAQYLAGQIHFQPSALLHAMFTRAAPESAVERPTISTPPSESELVAMRRRVDAVVQAFFEVTRPHVVGRLVVLLDGRRTGPATRLELIDLERAQLALRLREGGAEVIDLEPVYAKHAESSRRLLEVGPYDAHLNALGVRILMKAAAEAMR